MMKRRVVVTGMGLRTPIGNTLETFSAGLRSGAKGVHRMPEWEQIQNLRTRVAGLVALGEGDELPRKIRRGMGRVALLAALATRDAIAHSGLPDEAVASERCGVSFGSTAGSSHSLEQFLRQVLEQRSLLGMQSSTYLQFMSHTCAANVAVMFGAQGPVVASCTACTSGSQGVGFAYEAIQQDRADRMLAGGAEEMHFMDAGIFDIMRATSAGYNDAPERTPRPFDRRRDGLVVGEGAATLVLEEYEHAKKRGASIYAEIIGYGQGCNGTHPTNSDPDGICIAINLALRDAQLAPTDIQHINAHATGTDVGDAAEAEAIHRIFGAEVPVSGLKGYLSHTLGASGAIESVATMLMMREGFMAVTKNLEEPDPALPPIDHVLGSPRQERVRIAMNNNFAFGGINTSLIFRALS